MQSRQTDVSSNKKRTTTVIIWSKPKDEDEDDHNIHHSHNVNVTGRTELNFINFIMTQIQSGYVVYMVSIVVSRPVVYSLSNHVIWLTLINRIFKSSVFVFLN